MYHILSKYLPAKYWTIVKCQCFQITTCRSFCNYISDFSRKREVMNVLFQDKYHPQEVESEWYQWWESRNYFKSKPGRDTFAILLPPPNVTGTLHLGHALTMTIQDVILRWLLKRMKGKSVVWIPGLDHAGIATQTVVEKHLTETLGVSRLNLGREEFLRRVEEWKNEKSQHIIQQLKKMGASLDWDRHIYTMDPIHSELVSKSFIQLYNDGLIYRKRNFVNWSCALKSTISDLEVEYVEVKGNEKLIVPGYEKPIKFGVLYDFAYKVYDEDEEIIISTTRPETMLGDVAVAVHPDSPSHSKFLNKYLWHPFRNEKIPVIADPVANPAFGTGAVKITPAHSLTDYEVCLRHNLKAIEVINEDGLINRVGENARFHGLKRFDARSVMIDEMNRLGLFRGSKGNFMRLPVCSRSGDVIEPMLKKQWFLKCSSLASKAVHAVKSGELKLEPKSYYNVWIDWLETKSVRDWNLSRQLWWGHRIPMYRCQFGGEERWVASASLEEAKTKAAAAFGPAAENVEVVQDSDVLDTWFSSGLLPLNPMVRTGNGPPISLMVTGHDILFFWVARMVMLSLHFTGELPFKDVFLHSLVCDAKGKKMSKSLGNVVSPEHIIKGISSSEMKEKLEKDLATGVISQKNFNNALLAQRKMFPNGIPECGVDGLRFTLCSSCYRSAFVNFDVYLCQSSRFFCNKFYQAMNYFFRVAEKYRNIREEFELSDIKSEEERKRLNCFDKWILSRLFEVVNTVDESLASCTYSVATAAIRSFVIEEFCSNYLESSKAILEKASPLQYRTTVSVLFHCLETSLRLLCPLMPFLSEHLYQKLPPIKGFERCDSITIAPFPEADDWRGFRDVRLEDHFRRIFDLLSVLRKAKTLLQLGGAKPNVFVECPDGMADILLGDMEHVFNRMAGMRKLTRVDKGFQRANVMRRKVAEDCAAFVEHHHDKESLEKILSSDIRKEDLVKKNLQKLLSDLNTSQSENPRLRDHTQVKKVNSLTLELEKIKELKLAIELCDA